MMWTSITPHREELSLGRAPVGSADCGPSTVNLDPDCPSGRVHGIGVERARTAEAGQPRVGVDPSGCACGAKDARSTTSKMHAGSKIPCIPTKPATEPWAMAGLGPSARLWEYRDAVGVWTTALGNT